jgi:hypothetical protein
MNSSRSFLVAAVVLALLAVAVWWRRPPPPPPVPLSAPVSAAPRPVTPPAPVPVPPPAKRADVSPAGSTIGDQLNAPSGTIAGDLKILQELFAAYQSNFPRTGNPVGENAEITAALLGDNPAHFAFISRSHRALNDRGELCDRWGTPFRFHQLSGTEMEVRSAGPDRKFGTADDVVTPGSAGALLK